MAFEKSTVNEVVVSAHEQEAADALEQGNGEPFLDVRAAVLNDALEDCFHHRYFGFRPANTNEPISPAA